MNLNSNDIKLGLTKAIPQFALGSSTPERGSTKSNSAPSAYAICYFIFAAILLFITTIFWAIQGAHLQMSNADQLVDPYLFENSTVFHNAVFPAQHTFLLKWPLFWLIKLYGFSPFSFVAITVGLVCTTVFGLAYILYRIEKRPFYIGTLLLALASVLLLVPAQPYAGSLLPVNMAMLTTRNLEYLIYIISLILLIRYRHPRNFGFWAGLTLLGILIASDKLFLSLSIGGALLALIAYSVTKGWRLVSISVGWLIAGLIGALLAFTGLALSASVLNTHIVGDSNTAGPYQTTDSIKNIVLATTFGVTGLFSNMGTNPVFSTTRIYDIPHDLLESLPSPGTIGYFVNLLIFLAGLLAAIGLMRKSFARNRYGDSRFDYASLLSIALIWTSIAAMGAFIATDHYYPVDARYLSIAFFAIFVALATWSRRFVWKSRSLVTIGMVISVGIVFGIMQNIQVNNSLNNAYVNINDRNATVAQVLNQHRVDVLVGDYWRVLPIRNVSNNRQAIMPLQDCTQPRSVLSSTAWQPDLNKQRFAYLLTNDGSLADYPRCTLKQIVATYGRPNASALIDGTLANPKEQLLFYDKGANKSAPSTKPLAQGPSTVVPVSPDQLQEILPGIQCQSPTVLSVVAHEDDDILFMNPDILRSVQAGYCVRTIYITAGDAGHGKYYWLSREQGAQAAYSKMLNSDALWVSRILRLNSGVYVTVASPRGNPKIALIFMHLPDGNLKGQGFPETRNESLEKLQTGKIQQIHATDGQSVLTSASLVGSLTELMYLLNPTEVKTQSNVTGARFIDHSDHRASSRLVTEAYQQYMQERYAGRVFIPLGYYLGYSGHDLAPNLKGPEIIQKREIFLTYAQYDGSVCQTVRACTDDPAYGAYLTRQYTSTN